MKILVQSLVAYTKKVNTMLEIIKKGKEIKKQNPEKISHCINLWPVCLLNTTGYETFLLKK